VILSNQFMVAAPVEDTWKALMDVERVAACLPGARIEPVGEDGSYRGALKLKVGPVTMAYEGTVRLEDIDDTSRTLSYYASARDAHGTGGAAATIRARLTSLGGEARTRLELETDLNVTGRAAQFGRGIMQGAAAKMLGSFAQELERMIEQGDTAGPEHGDGVAGQADLPEAGARAGAGAGPSPTSVSHARAQQALDVGGALSSSLLTPRVAAVAAAGLALAYLAGRRQRTVRVVIVRPPE
jgi:carbon monoxide dehydrogenase subunit G